MTYIHGVVLEGQNTSQDEKKVIDFLDYNNAFEPKKTSKETPHEYVDYEEIA